MINFDRVTRKNVKTWLKIPYHQYKILITVGSRSRKINVLHNLISH